MDTKIKRIWKLCMFYGILKKETEKAVLVDFSLCLDTPGKEKWVPKSLIASIDDDPTPGCFANSKIIKVPTWWAIENNL